MKIVERNIPGGLRTIVLAPFSSELVSLVVVVRVGFAHESRASLGISHMVEHLCFSDNQTHTFPEFRSAIQSIGGHFNGYTSDEVTFYTMDVLVDYWREGLALLHNIVMNPAFSPEACEREKKVLLVETGQLRQRWLSWFYEHGWFKSVWDLLSDKSWGACMHSKRTFHRYNSMTGKMLQEWHQRYYRQDNMAAVVVGRVDAEEVNCYVEELFGAVEDDAPNLPEHPWPEHLVVDTAVCTRLGEPFSNQSQIMVGAWNSGARMGERGVYDVAKEYLQHVAYDSLRLKHNLAYHVGCIFDGRKNDGRLLLWATVKRGEEEKTEKLLREIFVHAGEHNLPESQLSAIRNRLLADYARMNANPGWYAYELIKGVFGGHVLDVEDYPDQLRAVNPASVRKVLKRLASERGTITMRQIPLLSISATLGLVAAFLTGVMALIVYLVAR